MSKIYNKKGAKNYKESRMVKAIEKAIEERKKTDPSFNVSPVNSFEELQKIHTELCTESISFEEVGDNTNAEIPKKDSEKEVEEKIKNLNKMDDSDAFVDPFNRDEPIVREYVLDDDGFSKEPSKSSSKTSFDEPTNFDDSFEIPSSEDDENNGKSSPSAPYRQKEPRKQESLNPNFDEMTPAKKKAQTKKFAKYIVEGVCTLSEKGFVMFANKDITPEKLIEYELTGEMNLGVFVTLENEQSVAVRDWLVGMRVQAERLAVISQDDRDELADSLADVLMEKGFAPTPSQILLMKMGQVFLVEKGLALMQLKMTTRSVLDQLRANSAYASEQTQSAKNDQQEEMINRRETREEDLSETVTTEESTNDNIDDIGKIE